jgi:hypothetical protein
MKEISYLEFQEVFKNRLIRRRKAIYDGETLDYTNCGKYFLFKDSSILELESKMESICLNLKNNGYKWEEYNPPRLISPGIPKEVEDVYLFFFEKPKVKSWADFD